MELLTAITSIILMDLILSGDNAVVIGMAAHNLPERQRKMAIMFGGIAAVLLRVINTSIAAILLLIPALKIVGGVLLVWIAFKLLKQEEERHELVKTAASLRGAIYTILTADFIMSLDNVLAVAGAAHGSVELLLFGLVLSMPIVLFCGSIVASLIDRLWWLAYVGAAVIAWTGAAMVLEDSVLQSAIAVPVAIHWALPVATVLAVIGVSQLLQRRPRRVPLEEPVVAASLPTGSADESDAAVQRG